MPEGLILAKEGSTYENQMISYNPRSPRFFSFYIVENLHKYYNSH
jgi:hypothetical protein